MQTRLAEIKTGMNWEIAALKMTKVVKVLEDAKSVFPHDCEVVIETREESDGGSYVCNTAPFYYYYLVVNGSSDTDPRFVSGIKDVLSAV